MIHKQLKYYARHLKNDIPAGIVVFLVALPLCLGIALASGAPLFSGLITGIVGGVIVSWASGSQLSVSGPAAGLTVIVLSAIEKLGSFDKFLLAVALAGALQFAFGVLRAGLIGAYFPTSVIKGMLAAIGIILIMKQLPHAIGYDAELEGDETYMPLDAEGTVLDLFRSFGQISVGAVIVSVGAILIILLWETAAFKRNRLLSLIPGPLLAVIWGVAYNLVSAQYFPDYQIVHEHLVQLSEVAGLPDFVNHFTHPDFSALTSPDVYVVAVTVAIVASLETLLSLEAVDKLDPLKRVAPTNQELRAQGIGNFLCGLIGGLPMTAVIVRSAANVNAGGRTKVASFFHGVLLLLSVSFLTWGLNLIPLATLAAILLLTGYKLAKPALFVEMYRKGMNQLLPFVITIAAILISDLLKGVAIGMVVGLFFVIKANFHAAITLTQDGKNYLLRLQKDVSFLNKALLRSHFDKIQEGASLIIDGSRAQFVDQDILESISDFVAASRDNGISVEVRSLPGIG
jgi:MFS superfamily sulfate permease-like transporter